MQPVKVTTTAAVNVEHPSSNESKDTGIEPGNRIIYGVEDVPPWYLCGFFGFQQFMTMAGGMVATPLILSNILCYNGDWVATSELFATMYLVSGITTLIQAVVGVRLPIIQGMSFTFIPPAAALMSLDQWKCKPPAAPAVNVTSSSQSIIDDDEAPWKSRMREIQGALIVAAFFEMLIGLTGLTGLLMRFIGPLTVAPVITLIGIMLCPVAADYSSKNWWMAFATMALVTLFSQYLSDARLPFCSFKERKLKLVWYPLLKPFPVILAILVSWAICAILTVTNAVPDDPDHWAYFTRVDTKIHVIDAANWFNVPYPFQFGWPTFSLAAIIGMMSAVISSIIESIGDYYACARISGAPVPPTHALNRGIFVEGFGGLIAAMLGAGSGMASYGENVAAIGIAKVASRRVIVAASVTMIVLGLIGKFGAIFVTIPEPVVGGVLLCLFGVIAAIGISNLQFVDMNSSRNIFIFGFSVFLGLSLSTWMQNHPDVIHTGDPILDQLVTVLAMSGIFVTGVLAFILDNTIAGTKKERGMTAWHSDTNDEDTSVSEISSSSTSTYNPYDLPFVTPFIRRRVKCARYVPISPTFVAFPPVCKRRQTAAAASETDQSFFYNLGLFTTIIIQRRPPATHGGHTVR